MLPTWVRRLRLILQIGNPDEAIDRGGLFERVLLEITLEESGNGGSSAASE